MLAIKPNMMDFSSKLTLTSSYPKGSALCLVRFAARIFRVFPVAVEIGARLKTEKTIFGSIAERSSEKAIIFHRYGAMSTEMNCFLCFSLPKDELRSDKDQMRPANASAM